MLLLELAKIAAQSAAPTIRFLVGAILRVAIPHLKTIAAQSAAPTIRFLVGAVACLCGARRQVSAAIPKALVGAVVPTAILRPSRRGPSLLPISCFIKFHRDEYHRPHVNSLPLKKWERGGFVCSETLPLPPLKRRGGQTLSVSVLPADRAVRKRRRCAAPTGAAPRRLP